MLYCPSSCQQGGSTGLTCCLSLCAAWRLLWWMAVQQGEILHLVWQTSNMAACKASQSHLTFLVLQVVGPFKGG